MPSSAAHIGDTLRRIRHEHRLSLRHVSERVGISVATLSRVETNKQNVDVILLLALARVLDTSVHTILSDGDGHDDEMDRAAVTRHLRTLQAAERAKLLIRSARNDGQPLPDTMDDLLATLDLLRAELVKVQRKVKGGGRGRRG